MQTTTHPSVRATNVVDLQTEAKALGVEVDPRWGPDRMTREIDEAKTKKAESETPDPDGTLETQGELVNVGSTADPKYEHRKD
jgi:hypothetical protein